MLSLDLIQIWCELDVRGERTVLDFRFSRKKTEITLQWKCRCKRPLIFTESNIKVA